MSIQLEPVASLMSTQKMYLKMQLNKQPLWQESKTKLRPCDSGAAL
jgi:hypothetical protein